MNELAPLLSRANSEVVFNFMFDFINRAASMKEPPTVEGIDALIPAGGWRERLAAADTPAARKVVLIEAFSAVLGTTGRYDYVAETPVLRPLKDRTLYSLVYGTRHEAGIEYFRECQRKTLKTQSTVRQSTKRAHAEAQSGQPGLFAPSVSFGPDEIEAYLVTEKKQANALLQSLTPPAPATTTYRTIWPRVLAKHAVTKPELNALAATLRRAGILQFPEWAANKRVPDDGYRMSRIV